MIVTQLSLDVVLVFFTVDFEHISHFFSSVSIVDFEQVHVCWIGKQMLILDVLYSKLSF